jgi:multiple sugar transport system permease protein
MTTARPPARTPARSLRWLGRTPTERRNALWGLALIAPNTLGLFVFFGIPLLLTFATAFQEWNGIRPPVFVGLDNFTRLFDDARFWLAVGNTARLALFIIPAELALSLGIAVLLNQRLAGRSIFRTLYFLPVVTSTVAASIVWTWIFQPRYGLLSAALGPFGLADVNWLTRPDLVLIPIAVVTVWQRIGFDMILFLSGLQNIPRDLHEAALIDGAGSRARFVNITLPLLSPTTFLVLVLSVIGALQVFDQVYIMTSRTTRGGVGGSASTITYFLYEAGFTRNEFGYASAVALVLFLFSVAITVFQLALQRFFVYYESGDGR